VLTDDRGPVLEFQRRSGYLLVAALLGHLLLISAQVSTQSGVSVLESALFGSLSRLQSSSASMSQSVSGTWDHYIALRGASLRADALQRELDQSRIELQHAQAQARRTEQLELILQLQRSHLPRTMAARVIAADPTAAFRTVTIDRGSADGVRRDMAVLSPLGIVGRVIDEPAAHAAKVQLIIDRNAGAGAVINRSASGGVVMGADGDPALRMEYVSNLSEVTPGDLVMTSGLDGIYPRGFVIGRIERAERGSGLYREIRIRPRVDFSSLDTVLLVIEPPVVPADAAAQTGAPPAPPAPAAPPAAAGGASPAVANSAGPRPTAARSRPPDTP